MFLNPKVADKLKPTKYKKVYCATCKEEIKINTPVSFSSTRNGLLKIHHTDCPIDKNGNTKKN